LTSTRPRILDWSTATTLTDLRSFVRDASDFDERKKLVGGYAHDLDPGAA
jgi:hypothetical protein